MFPLMPGPDAATSRITARIDQRSAITAAAGTTQRSKCRRRRSLHSGRTATSSDTSAEPMNTAIAKPMRRNDQFMARRASREPQVRQSIGQRMDEPILDCLIVGGGPGGPDRRDLSRALPPRHPGGGWRQEPRRWIPCTRNHAGYPDGIAGTELLQRMRDQACKYGAKIVDGVSSPSWSATSERPVHRDLGFRQREGADAFCSPRESRTAARRWTRSFTTKPSREGSSATARSATAMRSPTRRSA